MSGTGPSLGRAGHAIVPVHATGTATRCAQWRCRAPPGGAPLPGYPGSEEGRRRPIGVVAAFQFTTRATTPMGRRWVAEGGPEGRGSRNPRDPRSAPAYRHVPRFLGYALRSSSRLTGRRDARPHNTDAETPKAAHRAGVPEDRIRRRFGRMRYTPTAPRRSDVRI